MIFITRSRYHNKNLAPMIVSIRRLIPYVIVIVYIVANFYGQLRRMKF